MGFRYHGDWRSETQTAVSLLAFLHWLETGNLLKHEEAEKKLGCELYSLCLMRCFGDNLNFLGYLQVCAFFLLLIDT